jgi:glycosyltransferase involved in cell wall biosynthesis
MMKRVFLHFPYYRPGGSSMSAFCEGLRDTLRGRGFRVTMVAIDCDDDDAITLPSNLRSRVGRLNAFLLQRRLRQSCRHLEHDTFAILNVSQEFIAPFNLDRSLVVVHDAIQTDHPRSRVMRLLMARAWRLCRRARAVISVSRTTSERIAALGIESHVVLNHFDVDAFRAAYESHPVSPRMGTIWIGTAAPHKRFARFAQLAATFPGDSFTAVVPAFQRPMIEAAVRSPNLTVQSDLGDADFHELMLNSALFVSTSIAEGYGRPAMEALMLGCRCILTDIPVYREIYDGLADFFTDDDAACAATYARVRTLSPLPTPDYVRLAERQGVLGDYVALLNAEFFPEPVR